MKKREIVANTERLQDEIRWVKKHLRGAYYSINCLLTRIEVLESRSETPCSDLTEALADSRAREPESHLESPVCPVCGDRLCHVSFAEGPGADICWRCSGTQWPPETGAPRGVPEKEVPDVSTG